MTEEITREVDLCGSIMQKNIIENEFNREYALLATIQHCAAIKFMVKESNDFYLDLNNSRLHVLLKITNADGSNIGRTRPVQSTYRCTRCFARFPCSRTV